MKKLLKPKYIIIFGCLCLILASALVVSLTRPDKPTPERTVYLHGDFEYVVREDGRLEITKYIGTDTEINVPSAISGKTVASIGTDAFSKSKIRTVYLGAFTETVGDYAFAACTKLKEVSFSAETISIGRGAFADCTALEEIELSSGLTSIGEYAFSGCSALKAAVIPEKVISIGEGAYSGCLSLTSIDMAASSLSIGASAFRGCERLTELRDNGGIVSIGDLAFADCKALVSVELGAGIERLSHLAFEGSPKLASVSISPENKNFEVIGSAVFDKSAAMLLLLPRAAKTEVLTVPDYVRHIAPYALVGNQSINTVSLPDGLLTIGVYAFDGCSKLKTVNIPKSVTDIGCYAFYGTEYYKSLTDEMTVVGDGVLIKYNTPINSYGDYYKTEYTDVVMKDTDKGGRVPVGVAVTIPEGVTSIGEEAFRWCEKLTTITIPDSITSIGYRAFSYCKNLTIHAHTGSYAEKYAKKNKINFVAE